ncbi:GNAT family N-acetyltransferase [Mucilaginibacter myungsuensis]|uniref:GNAT family N-acetyltransferase n=1 Tax=Mucilaginibacter myungsuensis TaxID=649104 RepID=A0A929KVZ1_9SPHI|nr:GNAT family N-acetyltransferase [Mucilaginibacter myungsuensis]MBE9661465.1 GNAT family N-acetyltransferase [Mucilaginibacter myungsuensis]MDN3597608.1 GNAT family N-acetyltransferase [Mucilaginibacter myungsuensis]
MQIRKATIADIPAIMQVVKEVIPVMRASGNFQWDDKYPNPQVFESDIAADQLWVANVDGDLAGLVAITTEQYPEYAQAGLDISQTAIVIHRLAVSPRFKGKGVAINLVLQADAVAKERGIDILRIDTNAENKIARNLFTKAGYEFRGEITLQFRPGLKFVCFEKLL